MSEERPSRKKYVLLKLQVWPSNRDYVISVADALNIPINEAARRIFTDAESRGLFLPKGFRSENISNEGA
jgi:hypothetical protein